MEMFAGKWLLKVSRGLIIWIYAKTNDRFMFLDELNSKWITQIVNEEYFFFFNISNDPKIILWMNDIYVVNVGNTKPSKKKEKYFRALSFLSKMKLNERKFFEFCWVFWRRKFMIFFSFRIMVNVMHGKTQRKPFAFLLVLSNE